MNTEPSTASALLTRTLDTWASIYRHKMTKEEVDAWLRIFGKVPERVLSKAVDSVTKYVGAMPTPGQLTRAVAVAMEEQSNRGNANPECTNCNGTGWMLINLISSEESDKLVVYRQARRCDCMKTERLRSTELFESQPEAPDPDIPF